MSWDRKLYLWLLVGVWAALFLVQAAVSLGQPPAEVAKLRGEVDALTRLVEKMQAGQSLIDIERLGCEPGPRPAADNATILRAAFADRANNRPFLVPGRGYFIGRMIDMPVRTSYRIVGNGGVRYTGEGHYATAFGGPASRFVWEGGAGGTMLRVPGYGFRLEGLALEGKRAGNYPGQPRAEVGLHYVSNPGGGGTPQKSLLRLDDVYFYNLDVGVLAAIDRTPADAAGRYPGEEGNHSDTVLADRIVFGQVDRCYWVRSKNSVSHVINFLQQHYSANCTEIFYFERGGSLVCNQAYFHNGTLLRLGRPSSNNGEYRVTFHKDAVAADFKLLQMDHFGTGNPHISLSGRIGQNDYAVPIVEAKGSALVRLDAVCGLAPHSIKIEGQRLRNEDRVCLVILDGCTLVRCEDVRDVVHPDSKGPYRVVWRDCRVGRRAVDGRWIYGHALADGAEEVR